MSRLQTDLSHTATAPAVPTDLQAAMADLLDGLAVLQGLAETPQPPAGALGWLAVKLGDDTVRALDVAARIERATCPAVAA